MSTWIDDGIVAMETMQAELAAALGTLRKLKGNPVESAAPAPAPDPAPPVPEPPAASTRHAPPVATEPFAQFAPPAAPAPSVQRAEPVTLPELQKRDSAILARLRVGPTTRAELIRVLPIEAGKTPEQRASDCGNAIMRLKAKKLITATDTGWAIA